MIKYYKKAIYLCDYLEILAIYSLDYYGEIYSFVAGYEVNRLDDNYTIGCLNMDDILDGEREYTQKCIKEVSDLELPSPVENEAIFLLNSMYTEKLIRYAVGINPS